MRKRAKQETITVQVSPMLLRGCEDSSKGKTASADLATWRSAQDILTKWTYDSAEYGGEVHVDFGALVKLVEQSVSYELASKRERKRMNTKFILKPVELKCRVAHAGKSFSEQLVVRYFYDFFSMMNLASPGSCSFYGAAIKGRGKSNEISLSNHWFEWAWANSINNDWNTVDAIDLQTVATWYKALGLGLRQRAEARIERALFCLLHVARNDTLHPDNVVWLAHGLEAPFETSSERSQNSLITRCAALLAPPERKVKEIKDKLRTFYSLRSSFVHGGFPITHPQRNELLDRSIEAEHLRIMDSMDAGASMLVGSIQQLIRNGWKELRYSETSSPVPISDNQTSATLDSHSSRANHRVERPAAPRGVS